jgi:hypothetical protein
VLRIAIHERGGMPRSFRSLPISIFLRKTADFIDRSIAKRGDDVDRLSLLTHPAYPLIEIFTRKSLCSSSARRSSRARDRLHSLAIWTLLRHSYTRGAVSLRRTRWCPALRLKPLARRDGRAGASLCGLHSRRKWPIHEVDPIPQLRRPDLLSRSH